MCIYLKFLFNSHCKIIFDKISFNIDFNHNIFGFLFLFFSLRRNGAAGSSSQPLRPNEDGSHHLQEYTYKKITACDVCSQILRGN